MKEDDDEKKGEELLSKTINESNSIEMQLMTINGRWNMLLLIPKYLLIFSFVFKI